MQLLRKNWGVVCIILIGLILLSLLGDQATLLFLSIILTYIIIDSKLSNRIFSSKFYKLILSVVIYVAILQATILAAWLFDHNFPLSHSVVIEAILLLCALLWEILFYKKGRSTLTYKANKLFTHTDVISLAICLSIILLLITGSVVKSIKDYGSINIPAIAVSYVDVGLDNSTHLSMINDSLQLNRGVIYKSNEAKDVVLQSTISSYPPAWHSANAVIIESFYSKIKVGGQSIIAYVLTKFFWLFVLIFLFSRVVFDLFQILIRPDKHRRLLPAYTWLIGGIGFFSYYILIEQFEQGFYTFLPLLISLLIAIPLLIQLNFDNKENLSNKSRVLLPIILIVANLTLSWFLILPAVTIAILFAFLYPTKNNKVRDALLGMWSELSRVLPLVVLTVLAIVVQIILITVPSSQTFRVSIDTPGSIAIPAVAYFGFIFTGLALLYLLIHRQLSKLLDNLTLLLVFLLGFSFLIYLFQILTIQQPQYYYYKTLYTAMIVAMPMAIIGWLLLIELVTNKYRQLTAVILVFGLLICFPLIIGIQPPNGDSLFNYVIGRRALTTTESAYIYNSVSARARVPLDKRTSDVIFYEPGQIVDNIVATNILRGIKPVTNCDNEMFNDLFNDSETGLFSTIKGCETNPLTIVTNPDSYQLLKNLASSYNLGSNVTIRQID